MNNINSGKTTPFTTAETFRPAIWLENRISSSRQRQILFIAFSLLLLAGVVWIGNEIIGLITLPFWAIQLATTLVLISFLVLLAVGSIHSFYLYYRLNVPEGSDTLSNWEQLSFPAAELLLQIKDADDFLAGFFTSRYGRRVLMRAGVNPATLQRSIDPADSRSPRPDLTEALDGHGPVTLTSLAESVFTFESNLHNLLQSNGITEEVLYKSAAWIEHTDQQAREDTRFWSEDNLLTVTPVGNYFSYGTAYTLEDFSTQLASDAVFLGARDTQTAFSDDLRDVFNILARPRNANALLVGSKGSGVGDILEVVNRRLQTGEVPNQLADRSMYVLDTQALITVAESGGNLKGLLQKILSEAIEAGNVLLVIEDFMRFHQEVDRLGGNLFSLLDPALENPNLPIIATTGPDMYHQHMEGREIMNRFGSVLVHEIDDKSLFSLLAEVAVAKEGSAICTVGGLEAIGRGGRELITDDEMPHAAVGLLLEVLSAYPESIIDRELVEGYLSEKTGVPTGSVDDQERDLLRNLEDRLHERIVGQQQAVTAVASSLRRTRAGVEDPHRPIGSFLFIGPTGVGKTETAKTLDQVYFTDSSMRRLDMSEYSQSGAIDDLRGSAGESGRLADIVREQPYGVLLLDEFEKADSAVLDLFLQILDEGHFTDGAGREVNLDNMIIIATSNAGARTIFSLVEEGADLQDRKRDIINELISSEEFRPELINRFDETVLFHPLTESELVSVTNLLLDELRERLKQRGFRLQIGDNVAAYLVNKGYDPEFGARAIRRVIQEEVENVVADTIIDEELSKGDKIKLTVDDLRSNQ